MLDRCFARPLLSAGRAVPRRRDRLRQLRKLTERQIAAGSHGLLVNATSGEPTMLTVQERGDLVEFAIKVSNGRRPVCAGTASES
jgi:dihydrodipicolinate synthase/N-acetylneuraminate lyase